MTRGLVYVMYTYARLPAAAVFFLIRARETRIGNNRWPRVKFNRLRRWVVRVYYYYYYHYCLISQKENIDNRLHARRTCSYRDRTPIRVYAFDEFRRRRSVSEPVLDGASGGNTPGFVL